MAESAANRGRRAAAKGADYERQIARELTELTGEEHIRNLDEMRDQHSVANGDVVTREDRPRPLCIQTKVGIRVNPWKAYREAEEASKPTQHPVAIVKANRGSKAHTGSGEMQERVVISKDFFFQLITRSGLYDGE